jgi:hypothetical protein
MYVATTKDEGNAADGRFSTACERAVAQIVLATIIHSVYKDGKDNNRGVLP